MPTTVDIPGVGSVDFPDEMNPEQIRIAAAKLHSGGAPQEGSQSAMGAMAGQMGTVANNIGQGAIGLAKSVPQTALGLGQAIRKLVGAQGGTEGVAQELAGASNPQQQSGVDVGKLLQFLLSGAATGGASLPAQVAGEAGFAGALGAGQSGKFGGEAAATAAAGGAGPLIGRLLEGIGPRLAEGAQRQMARVLGPTTRENKAITEKVVPGLLDRGTVVTSRESLAAKAAQGMEESGAALDEALKKIPTSKRVDTRAAYDRLEGLKDNYLIKDAAGNMVPANAQAADAIGNLQNLQTTLLGTDTSFANVRRLRQILDSQVTAGKKAFGRTIAEGTQLDATREAANAIRAELAKASPDVAKINKEFSFWSNVDRVVGATLERTQSQSTPLNKQILRATGLATTVTGHAPLGGALTLINELAGTALWRSASAVSKNRIATALAGGDGEAAIKALARLAAGGISAGARPPDAQDEPQ